LTLFRNSLRFYQIKNKELSCCWDGRAVLRMPHTWHILSRSRIVSRLSRSISHIFALTHCFSVISENIAINHILPKARFFGLHSCCRLQPLGRSWPPKPPNSMR